ncbi:MAG TPA: hypothetical protein VHJ17_18515 [Thermomonospora sp.]|nr:hypothetical protein [Thermomonospora sp.]
MTPTPVVQGQGCDTLPSWSPDRSKVAFLRRNPAGHQELWLVGADGRGERRLHANVANRSRPVWSPDGRSLAYLRQEGDGEPEIYVMDLSGGERRLTEDGAAKHDLSWSPQGRIAFYSGVGAERQIYTVRADVPGDPWRRLTTAHMAPNGVDDPHWSPDGTLMAFTVKAQEGPNAGDQNIGVVRADGTGFRLLTTTSHNDHDPTWSPGGKWLAFVRGLSPNLQVWAMPLGEEKRAQRLSPDHVGHACWT